jgi:hypothetical protein
MKKTGLEVKKVKIKRRILVKETGVSTPPILTMISFLTAQPWNNSSRKKRSLIPLVIASVVSTIAATTNMHGSAVTV